MWHPHSCNVPPYNSTHKQNCRLKDQVVDSAVNSPAGSYAAVQLELSHTTDCTVLANPETVAIVMWYIPVAPATNALLLPIAHLMV